MTQPPPPTPGSGLSSGPSPGHGPGPSAGSSPTPDRGSPGDSGDGSAGDIGRGTLGGLGRAAVLVWRSAPVHVLGYVAVTLVASITPVAVAWLTKAVLDGIAQRQTGALLALAVAIAAVTTVAAAATHAGDYLRAEVDRRTALRAKDELFAAVCRFTGLARFESPEFLDRLRLAHQSASNPGRLVDASLSAARGAVTAAGFVASLALINVTFTVLVVLSAVPALLIELRMSRQRNVMLWRIGPAERRELFYAELMSTADAAKEIRLFGLGSFLRLRMLDELRTANAARRRLDRRELVVHAGLSGASALLAGAGLIWGILAAGQGRLGVGDVAMFVAAVAGVQGALNGMVATGVMAYEHLLTFRHHLAIVTAAPDLPPPTHAQPAHPQSAHPAPIPPEPIPPEPALAEAAHPAPAHPEPAHPEAAQPEPGRPDPAYPESTDSEPVRPAWSLPALRRGIELRDVWFRYGENHPWILRGVDLVIPHGATVALIGHNGAGKSTLVKLLCRFYDPIRGAILWDGVDLRDVAPEALRARIGAVFQDFVSYELTVADNITVGDLSAADDRARIETAAREAGVHDTVAAFPHGYRTLLSRAFTPEEGDGVLLSGGQWQRLALARAFLRHDRDLMICDEPSAGLDPEAEYEVHRRLARLRSGRTSVVISHRLGAIRDADRIVVLSGGVVAEQGTHAELLAEDGTYARLFTRQATGYRDDDPAPHDDSTPRANTTSQDDTTSRYAMTPRDDMTCRDDTTEVAR